MQIVEDLPAPLLPENLDEKQNQSFRIKVLEQIKQLWKII